MAKRVDSLTVEQQAKLPVHRDKWIGIGLSTDAMTGDDRAHVERTMRAMYRHTKIEEPKAVIFVPSPMVLRVASGIAAGTIHAVRRGWPGRSGSAVDRAVGSAVGSAVRSAVRSAVDRLVRSAVRSAVDSAVDPNTLFLLRCADGAGWSEWGGNMWCAWTAWRTFFRDHCGLELGNMAEPMEWVETVYSQCGPFSTYADFVMVSDRPVILRRDAAGRLHSNDGPAIAWRDGWDIFFWHDLRIPRSHEWMLASPEQLTPDKIEAEPNAELRRVALEIFGFDRYLKARDAIVVSEDINHGLPRRLLELNIRGDRVRVLEVQNGSLEPDGSRRKFHLGAMRGNTPHECVAASYGRDPQRYREGDRT